MCKQNIDGQNSEAMYIGSVVWQTYFATKHNLSCNVEPNAIAVL